MKKIYVLASLCVIAFLATVPANAAKKRPIPPLTDAWIAKVKENAPEKPIIKAPLRKVLIYSKFTGHKHDVIPHIRSAMEILGKKSGAFEPTCSEDIETLMPENLAKFDAIVLNNCNADGPRRNQFYDALKREAKYKTLSPEEREKKAEILETSLLDFVRNGKGVVVVHSGLGLLNKSPEYNRLIGSSLDFSYHPPAQPMRITPVDPDHPLAAAFKGKTPFVLFDELYYFTGIYQEKNFLPILQIDTDAVKDPKGQVAKKGRYISWVKPYGKGRVFYFIVGHFPESFQNPTVLRFYLDAIQYATGDLKCKDRKDY